MNANIRIRFGLQIVFVCLYITPSHYHHCANFIWRHWAYKIPVRYNLSSVWVRLSMFSQLSIIQYVGLCIFSLPISFVTIERIYILCLIIIIKSEVWTITHYLGLGHKTMVWAVCLSIFLFLWTKFDQLIIEPSGKILSESKYEAFISRKVISKATNKMSANRFQASNVNSWSGSRFLGPFQYKDSISWYFFPFIMIRRLSDDLAIAAN